MPSKKNEMAEKIETYLKEMGITGKTKEVLRLIDAETKRIIKEGENKTICPNCQHEALAPLTEKDQTPDSHKIYVGTFKIKDQILFCGVCNKPIAVRKSSTSQWVDNSKYWNNQSS